MVCGPTLGVCQHLSPQPLGDSGPGVHFPLCFTGDERMGGFRDFLNIRPDLVGGGETESSCWLFVVVSSSKSCFRLVVSG